MMGHASPPIGPSRAVRRHVRALAVLLSATAARSVRLRLQLPTRRASDLGADGVAGALWFNVIAMASGRATAVAAFGWVEALRSWKVSKASRAALGGALVSIGAASFAAGAFPLPDQRHGGGALGIGLFALPLLLVVSTVRSRSPRWIRRYALGNLMLFAVAALMFGGATFLDPHADAGILQRLLAASVFLPIGVVSAACLGTSTGAGANPTSGSSRASLRHSPRGWC